MRKNETPKTLKLLLKKVARYVRNDLSNKVELNLKPQTFYYIFSIFPY